MTSLEKLFIGFWVWHTLEWAYSSFGWRKDRKKYLECREKEIERLDEEIQYFKTLTVKHKLELAVMKYKAEKETGLIEDHKSEK